MIRIEIKKWNGQFNSPKVIQKIRRKIAGALGQKETVLVDFEDVNEIPPAIYREIIRGWDELQVKIIGCGKGK